MITQDIEVDDASKSLVASWFTDKDEADEKGDLFHAQRDKKKKKKKVVKSVNEFSSDEETSNVPDYSDGKHLDPHSFIKQTASSYVGQKLDKKLRKAKYAKTMQEEDDTEKMAAGQVSSRKKKKTKGDNSDESEDDSKVSLISKAAKSKTERPVQSAQAYSVESLEQKLKDSSLTIATKKRLKKKLSKLKQELNLSDKISQNATEKDDIKTISNNNSQIDTESGTKSNKDKKKKRKSDAFSHETETSHSGDSAAKSDENKKAVKSPIKTETTSPVLKKAKKRTSLDDVSTPQTKTLTILSSKKFNKEETATSEVKAKKQSVKTSPGELSLSKKKAKKHSLTVSLPPEVTPAKKKKHSSQGEITDPSENSVKRSMLTNEISLMKTLRLRLISPEVSSKERKKIHRKIRRIKHRIDKDTADSNTNWKKKNHKLKTSLNKNVKKAMIDGVKKKKHKSQEQDEGKEKPVIKNKGEKVKKSKLKTQAVSTDESEGHIGEEKKRTTNTDTAQESSKSKVSKNGYADHRRWKSRQETAAKEPKTGENQVLRKKKRSKQKNIKKDNRPDHMKPAHLRANKEDDS